MRHYTPRTGSLCIACRSRDCLHLRPSRSPYLTLRELSIMRQVGEVLQNKQIASNLGLSEGTVKVLLSKIFAKLGYSGAGSRTNLTLYARANAELLAPQNTEELKAA